MWTCEGIGWRSHEHGNGIVRTRPRHPATDGTQGALVKIVELARVVQSSLGQNAGSCFTDRWVSPAPHILEYPIVVHGAVEAPGRDTIWPGCRQLLSWTTRQTSLNKAKRQSGSLAIDSASGQPFRHTGAQPLSKSERYRDFGSAEAPSTAAVVPAGARRARCTRAPMTVWEVAGMGGGRRAERWVHTARRVTTTESGRCNG